MVTLFNRPGVVPKIYLYPVSNLLKSSIKTYFSCGLGLIVLMADLYIQTSPAIWVKYFISGANDAISQRLPGGFMSEFFSPYHFFQAPTPSLHTLIDLKCWSWVTTWVEKKTSYDSEMKLINQKEVKLSYKPNHKDRAHWLELFFGGGSVWFRFQSSSH